MSFPDLRAFLLDLERRGELARVRVEADPALEITAVQHRVLPAGGPALLWERVRGSPHRLATNLFGTRARVERVFGRPPAELGDMLARLATDLMPPTPARIWANRSALLGLSSARMRTVASGPVLEREGPPDLDAIPCLTCWPLDGGPFFTLPLVHTCDPDSGAGNLGVYRLQRFDRASTGMHWQIAKGGGAHFHKARALGRPLPVSVVLGGPPALTVAAVAPLPEGVDERLLAALMLGRPLEVLRRAGTGHRVPAAAEFVLEGSVRAGDERQEGPFGDHLGHYSHSAPFPVFRVERMLARRDAICPATVVGKPPQEDWFLGCALQEMGLPVLRLMHPGILDLWAYPETGFHPLAVAATAERYPREALAQACAILGHGQLALTKVVVVTGAGTAVRDFAAVSAELWRHLDEAAGVHLLAPTAQDTLDFTGPAMNEGSRLVLLAPPGPRGPLRGEPPPDPPPAAAVHKDILGLARVGPAVLVAQVRAPFRREEVFAALRRHPATARYLLQVIVSADVPLDDPRLLLWGWFTRFDPAADLHPAGRSVEGNRLVLRFPLGIDATWKEGYRRPVAMDPDVEELVTRRWDSYGIRLP